MDAKDAKKDANSKLWNFRSVRNILPMHQLMVTFSDSLDITHRIYNKYDRKEN